MTSHDFILFALQIALMLAFGLFFGQLLRRRRQPAVVGEMLAGILLGPTVVGALFPGFYSWLFLSSEQVAAARDAMIKLGMLLFLFVAGLDVDLPDLSASGRRPLLIGLVGTLLPIAAGVALVYALQAAFWGPTASAQLLPFAVRDGAAIAGVSPHGTWTARPQVSPLFPSLFHRSPTSLPPALPVWRITPSARSPSRAPR